MSLVSVSGEATSSPRDLSFRKQGIWVETALNEEHDKKRFLFLEIINNDISLLA